MVAITLDDGPHKTLTERAMNAFEKYNGRGTFFELGQNMNLYQILLNQFMKEDMR